MIESPFRIELYNFENSSHGEREVMSCSATLCYVMSRDVMSRHVMPSHVSVDLVKLFAAHLPTHSVAKNPRSASC